MCYRKLSIPSTPIKRGDVMNVILIALIASFGALTIILLIILFVRLEFKWAMVSLQREQCRNHNSEHATKCEETVPLLEVGAKHSKGNGEVDTSLKRTEDDTDGAKRKQTLQETGVQTDIVDETDEWADFVSLSGKIKERYAPKVVKTIKDLREKLSTDLNEPIDILSIVDKETGKIYQDDTKLEPSRKEQYIIMVGNKNRKDGLDDDGDGYVETDVINNKHITKGKFMMCCGHFTAPETLFDWIKEELCSYEDEEIKCPKCEDSWEIDDVLKICNLSEDEKIFFKRVKELYTTTQAFMKRCYGDVGDDDEIEVDEDENEDGISSLFSE